MAQADAPDLSRLPGEHVAVDTDVHVSYFDDEFRGAVASRMEEPYASYVSPETRGKKQAYPIPRSGWAESWGGLRDEGSVDRIVSGEDVERALREGVGVDHVILNPLPPLDEVRETGHALAEMPAVNDVVAERFLDGHDGISSCISVAAREPHAAAEEIDRVGDEDGFVGVALRPGCEYQKPLGDPRYDVIYDAAADHDLTMVYHGSERGMTIRGTPILNDYETFLSAHVAGFPWSLMLTLTSLIVQGVPEKFPELNFVMLEAGVGWIPYWSARLNREVAWRKFEAPLLERTPEEYVRDRFYFGTQPIEEYNDPGHLERILEVAGPELLLFTTDYPHWDFDDPGVILDRLGQFSPAERDRILHGNAEAAYGKLSV